MEKFESPATTKEDINGDIEYFNTIFKRIKPGKEANNIRLQSFEQLSPNMKEALLCVGKIFKDAKSTCPWAIHGSTALVLEGETSKQPVDIDLAFGKPDFENVFAEFKNLEQKNLVRKLKTEEMKNFKDEVNGCTKIFAEIKTGENPETWIEVEAFAQNVDPKKSKNGITNPGLEKTGINVYDKENIEINFADREENFKFYLQVAYIELQKYQLDNRFLHVVKNKFPQRLQNLISIIKREEREEFEIKLKNGETTEENKPSVENITDENIDRLIEEFVKYNSRNEALQLSDVEHAKIDPVEVMKTRFNEFKNQRESGINLENKGFIHQKIENKNSDPNYTRENAIDELTFENLEDIENIAKDYIELIDLSKKLTELKNSCEQNEPDCDDKTKSTIKEKADDIFSKTEKVFNSINKIKNNYEQYLTMINYKDNRDCIAYVAIKQILSDYINPSIELAIVSQSEIEEIRNKYGK